MYHVAQLITNNVSTFMYPFGYRVISSKSEDLKTLWKNYHERRIGVGSPALPVRLGIEITCSKWSSSRILVVEVCSTRASLNPDYFWGFTISYANTDRSGYRSSWYRAGVDAVLQVHVKRDPALFQIIPLSRFPRALTYLGRVPGSYLESELIAVASEEGAADE